MNLVHHAFVYMNHSNFIFHYYNMICDNYRYRLISFYGITCKKTLHNNADVLVGLVYFDVILKYVCLGYFYENNKHKNKQ